MPSAAEILTGLTRIANEAFGVSIVWHAVVAWSAVALWLGVRPTRRVAAMLLSIPLASVALLAWVFGNPFNGAVFALAAGLLALLASRAPAEKLVFSDAWSLRLGAALVAFAWVYPHFLEGHSPVAYLYGAPLGVVPCPTLSLVVGAALLGRGLVAGLWRLALALLAAFYGIFGMLRLGVWIDGMLLVGAVALAVQHWRSRSRRPTPTRRRHAVP